MPRALVVTVAAALAIAPAAGCGGSDNQFSDGFDPLEEKLTDLGERVHRGLQFADAKRRLELARQFDGFAGELGDLRAELLELEPPSDVESWFVRLGSEMEEVQGSLRGLAAAVRRRDRQSARTLTIELLLDGETMDEAMKRLEEVEG